MAAQDGAGMAAADAEQRLLRMGGRTAWRLRQWVEELCDGGGYNALMDVSAERWVGGWVCL